MVVGGFGAYRFSLYVTVWLLWTGEISFLFEQSTGACMAKATVSSIGSYEGV